MGLIVTLIIGGVIGWLASLVMKTGAQMGVIANIIVGILGPVHPGSRVGSPPIGPPTPEGLCQSINDCGTSRALS
jgi:uncharacterized membrane protein YeaQ/YmgE (transglycosylase-associated protein family)